MMEIVEFGRMSSSSCRLPIGQRHDAKDLVIDKASSITDCCSSLEVVVCVK
jgi:hypothetical protein